MTGRQKALTAITAALLVVLTAAGSVVLGGYIDRRGKTDARLTAIAVQNRANGEDIKRALALILSVTGPDAQSRQGASTLEILKRNAIETDCRSRRQQARLAAPDPARSCAEQTDPSVYPGVDGRPSR